MRLHHSPICPSALRSAEHAFAGPFDDVNKQFQPADHIPVDEKERYDAAQKEKQKEYDHSDL